METLKTINFVIAVIFFVCYTYQFLYIPVPWLRKARPHGPAKDNRYAVLICARNEQRVIGDLIASLRGQTYSQGLLSIFVLADNCTDDTAMVARVAGANVYERFNQVQVGKGYALQELLEHLEQDYPQGFDGYFVFDADNILAPNYVEAMNRTFSDGPRHRHQLPQQQELRRQLDQRRLCPVVPAGEPISQPRPVPAGHQLRRVRHRLPVQPPGAGGDGPLALPPADGGYPVLRGPGDPGPEDRLLPRGGAV